MVPSLVYMGDANHPDGTTANLDTDAMLHHFVMINPGRPDPVCPGGLEGQLGERFFAAGNERSQMHLPCAVRLPEQHHGTWRLISHIINKSATVQKSFQIEVVFQYRTVPRAAAPRPSRCGSTSTAAATPSTRRRSATTTPRSTGSRT